MNNIQRKIRKVLIVVYEKVTGNFITVHNRPIFAGKMDLWADVPELTKDVAIIIQGPILAENNFTLETVKHYRKVFPFAKIILSTWKSEDQSALDQIEKLGAVIVKSDKPEYRGPFNENMQIVSSINGIKRAKELGAKYALKSRTDQRIYSPNALEFMINLLKAFPYTAPFKKQKQRIVACSLATLKYRPYGVTDMTLFGDIDDMILYWDCPLDMRPLTTGKNTSTVQDFTNARICEMYFATEFMKKIGRVPAYTIKDSWDFFADHIVIADQDSLDVYWRKYEHHQDNRFTFYETIRNDQDLTFREWLNLYINRNRPNLERSLEIKFHGTITK